MNVRHLEFFVAVAREGHFGRAAAACHVSQPALSMALRRLEAELGTRLVERGTGGTVGLTDAGAALIDRARLVVRGVEDVRSAASALQGRLTATLRLGTVPTAVTAVARLTAPLLREHPGVRIRIRTAPTDVLSAQILRRELDAAMLYGDRPRGELAYRPLYRERLLFAEAADAAPVPGNETTIDWRAVAEHELCLLVPEMQHRTIVDDALEQAGAIARARVETDSFVSLLGFVRQGWPTVIGHPWLLAPQGTGALRTREIVGPSLAPTIALATASGQSTPAVRALLTSLAGRAAENLDPAPQRPGS